VYLGNYLLKFTHPDTEQSLQLWSKRAWLLLQLAADLDVIHVMLVLQPCRMQELWGHGGFHPNIKGRSGRPGNVWQIRISEGSSREGEV
jgi:hypothetical protein